jgi:hypothetical protein
MATISPEITITLHNGKKKPYAIAIVAYEVRAQLANGPTTVFYLDRVISDQNGEFIQPPGVHDARISDMIKLTTFLDIEGHNKVVLNKMWRGDSLAAKQVWDMRKDLGHIVAGLRFESTKVPYNRADDKFWFPPQKTSPSIAALEHAHGHQPTIDELVDAIKNANEKTSGVLTTDSTMHDVHTPREDEDDPSSGWS